MALIIGSPLYKHRKYRFPGSTDLTEVPSWGEEGWTYTPFYTSEEIESDCSYFTINYSVEPVPCVLVKVKSTLLLKRLQILDHSYCPSTGRGTVAISGSLPDNYAGGIISIARFTDPYPDEYSSYEVDLLYKPESGSVNPVCAVYYKDQPLKLNPNQLHSLRIVTEFEGWLIPIPTAWVDPGFEGTLFVPFCQDAKARLQVKSWNYEGNNRYDGYYTGENRLTR